MSATDRNEWVPEFEGQRPPFAPGNDLAVTHGAYSPKVVDPLAQALVDLMLGDPAVEYLKAPAFRPALLAWARAEAQAQLFAEWLAARAEVAGNGVGDLDDEAVRFAYLGLHRAEARADRGRARLGLDPLSRARLGKDVAQGAAAASITGVMADLRRLEAEGKLPASGGADS